MVLRSKSQAGEGRRSFLKKRSKKLLSLLARRNKQSPSTRTTGKSFLLLFSKKKAFACLL
jgi:hypothetical protein